MSLSDIQYIMSEVLDKWEDANPICDHGQRDPLRHALPTVQKTGHNIPIPQNEQWPATIPVKDKETPRRP